MSKASELELPKAPAEKDYIEQVTTSGIGFAGLNAVPQETEEPLEDFEVTDEMIPTPTGYHILVALPEQKDTYDQSVIVRSEKEKRLDADSCVAVRVIALGDDCYSDKKRFPNGPWCKVGDYVLIQSYQGTKFKVLGRDLFRIINDDNVEAVVEDPTVYSRI